jgi:hypothetical protein
MLFNGGERERRQGYDLNGNLILSKVGEGVFIVRGEKEPFEAEIMCPARAKSAAPAAAPDRPAHRPARLDLHRPAGTQPGDTSTAPGKSAKGTLCRRLKPGGPVFTPAANRTLSLHAKPVRDRWLHRASQYGPSAAGPYAGPAGFHAGRQPDTIPEQDSGKGPVAVPGRPAQSPAPPALSANTGKLPRTKSFLPANFWQSVWQLLVVGQEKENRPPSH